MKDSHLKCPKCGYDLYGIPQVRCPECGFRYDFEALRSLASAGDWKRFCVARSVLCRAAIGGVLLVPAVSLQLALPLSARVILLASAYVGMFFLWTHLFDLYTGLSAVPGLVTIFVAGTLVIVVFFPFSHLMAFVAALVIASTWVRWLWDRGALSPVENLSFPEFRSETRRYDRFAWCLLIVASALSLVAWVA